MMGTIPAKTLEKFTTFGDLLRFLRRRLGLTQLELSIAVGYSDAQITRLEKNQRPPDIPTIETRFVEALRLEDEPLAVARLLDLAAAVSREDAPSFGVCPYKGLTYFDEADADLFVGREALTATLVQRLLDLISADVAEGGGRFLAVVGASGSGKSSLVRAGVVPALRWEKRLTDWHIHILTPTARPIESLAGSLVDSVAETATLIDDLTRDPRSLHLFARRMLKAGDGSRTSTGSGRRLILVIDQFEELFALCRAEEERSAFVDSLLAAAHEADGPVAVIITLRADFYAHCAAYPQLRAALAAQQEYIGAMSAAELKRAIEEPARRGNWDLEPGLAELLLHDVGGEPGALPLLSHALMETWHRRRGRAMTLSGYASSGGVRGAIAETAESVFTDQLSHEQQAIARRIFLRLTELGEETSTGDTRRRATFDELVLKPEETQTTRAVLTALADARLVTVSEDAAEVAHEALIREWPTLRGWLEEDREGLRLHRQLTEAAREWAAMDRDPDALYRGIRLAQARDSRDLNEADMNALEREFLDASVQQTQREAAEREAQRQRELEAAQRLAEEQARRADEQALAAGHLRFRAYLLGAAFALALLLAGVAIFYANYARTSFIRADAQRLAAEANGLLKTAADPQLIALLSLRSVEGQYTIEGGGALTGAAGQPLPKVTFAGNGEGIYNVTFSPDGKYVLTGGYDGIARLFDAQSGRKLQQFEGFNAGVRAVFSPDGDSIAISSLDGTARMVDAETGEELRSYTDHTDTWLTDIKISPDGKYLLTAAGDGIARLWDEKTGQKVCQFTGHTNQLRDVAFSPDGRFAATASLDLTARIWQTDGCKQLRVLSTTDGLASVDFSPDGKYLATSGWDGPARIWDIETGQEVREFPGHTCYWLGSVRFSPDGKYLLTGSCDRTAKLWDVETGNLVQTFSGHTDDVNSVAFSPDGRYILTGGADKTAWSWDLNQVDGEHPAFAGHTDSLWSVAVSPDGKRLATGGAAQSTRLWDPQTGQELHTFTASDVNSVAFSPDGRLLLAGDLHGQAWLYSVETGQALQQFDHTPDHSYGIQGVAFSPDAKYVVTSGQDGYAKRWNVQTGESLTTYSVGQGGQEKPENLYGVAFSPDGKYVLTGGFDGVMRLWDAQSGKQVRQFSGHEDKIYGVAFSPDGRLALSAGGDKTARLWDVRTGEELKQLTGHTAYLYSVAFSPDGKLALTGSADNTARLWDLQTGLELARFSGHKGPVEWAAFSPDGRNFFTASDDGTARMWDVDYRDTLRYLCTHLLRDFTDEERAQYEIRDKAPTCSTD